MQQAADLTQSRQSAAQKAFEDYDFGAAGIEGCSGWEWIEGGSEWVRKLYFTPGEDNPDGSSLPGHFSVRFKDGSSEIAECYAMCRGLEVGAMPQLSPSP